MSETPPIKYMPMQEDTGMASPPPYPQPVTAQPGSFHSTNTTVVVNQPASQIVLLGPRDWSSGLCGCCEDCYSCCLGCFCPCCLLCEVSSRMGEGCMFATCCPGALMALRVKLRMQENIQGSLCDDYCVTQCSCCSALALCQLARELNHIGR